LNSPMRLHTIVVFSRLFACVRAIVILLFYFLNHLRVCSHRRRRRRHQSPTDGKSGVEHQCRTAVHTHHTHTCHSLPQFLANVKPHNNTILMSVCVRAHVRVCVCDVVSLLVTVVRGQRGAEQGSDCRSSSLRSPPQKNASPKRQRARESARGICICANVRPRKRARERPTQCVCFVSCVTKQRRETP